VRAGARVLCFTALVVALAEPIWRGATPPGRRIIAAVDVSQSLSDAEVAAAATFVGALEKVASQAEDVAAIAVVGFADRTELLIPPRAPSDLARLPNLRVGPPATNATTASATDIAAALRLSGALATGDLATDIVVISDGRATRGDAVTYAARLARRGVRVSWWKPPASRPPADIAVVGVTAPDVVRPGAPFDLNVDVRTSMPARTRVRLLRDGQPADTQDRTVSLVPGANVIKLKTEIPEGAADGRALFEVIATPLGPDASGDEPRNNRAFLPVQAARTPRVALVAELDDETNALARALAAQKIDTVRLTPRAILRRDLSTFDLVLLANVPRTGLGDRWLSTLRPFVENGGGLLVGGGPASLGSGGYERSPLAELLPVSLDVPAPRREATLALALVIDRSGSMSGTKMEVTKEAARATALALPPDDLIAVIAFDSRTESIVRLQKAGNRQRILGQIDRIAAGGGTSIIPAVREAYQQLLPVAAQKKHIILLSDGQSHATGLPALISEIGSAQITVSSVGVGTGADKDLLRQLAERTGGRFHLAQDPASIPRIFVEETASVRPVPLLEDATRVRVLKTAAVFAGLDLGRAPPLDGYNLTRARPRAELLVETTTGHPVLARWRVGLGQVVVWTSDFGPRWASAWARAPLFAPLWAQLVRDTMRARPDREVPLRVAPSRDRGTRQDQQEDRYLVTLKATDDEGRPVMGLSGRLRVDRGLTPVAASAPAGAPSPGAADPAWERVLEVAPGEYEAAVRIGVGEAVLLHMPLSSAGASSAKVLGRGGFGVAYPAEFAPVGLWAASAPGAPAARDSGTHHLAAIGAAGQGHELALSSPLPRHPPRGPSQPHRPLAPWLAALAAVLFVAEAAAWRATFRAL
jgi:Mg-chelatase subunit ChlD/uncharacterized membrane protein